MKSFLPLLSLVLVFGSCTAAYKTGQTPDDVYFSPARQYNDYVRIEKDDDRSYRGNRDEARYDEDRYLRMKVRDRQRWVYLDDYYRDPYAYRYSNRYYYNTNGYCNPRSYWNDNYNPYGTTVHLYPKSVATSKPRKYNLHVFDDPKTNTVNPKLPSTSSRDYDTRSRSSNVNTGTVLRTVFGSSESSPSKSSSNSSSGSSQEKSSGSGSGSKTNATTRKF